MSQLINNELKVVAVVQFNKGEALVLNRPINFTYEQIGNDYIGTDGPLTRALYYSRASDAFRAFAGSELILVMTDGSVRKIKDHWWSGMPSEHRDVAVGDVESLKKCYVFGSASIRGEDLQALRESYTGCVYPYWDYEKVIKYDDIRMDLYRRLRHEEKRVKALIEEVKRKHRTSAELASFRTAYMEWSDKTDWVRTDKRFDALKPWGKHRADVLKAYIEHLESHTLTAAATDVLAERQRQITAEGWTPGHDDEYEHGELADAAGCYALSSELFDCAGEPPRPWPWPDEWWKPTNRRRDLVKAGALILAEIERIDRTACIKEEAK
ncbi:TPA: hypothetical protein ACHOZM_004994 [Raoultella ornithinolytica]